METQKQTTTAVLFTIGVALVWFVIFCGGIRERFFPVDDIALILIPQLKSVLSSPAWLSILTPGNHLDYYPVRDLSYYLDIHLWGGDTTGVDASIYRLTNLALFAASAGIVVWLLAGWVRLSRACLVAAFWAFHPVHSELVMWASARKDLLGLFFALLSLAFLLKAARGKNRACYTGHFKVFAEILPKIFIVIFGALSFFSKSAFVLFPWVGVLALLSFPQLRKNRPFKQAVGALVVLGLGVMLFQTWFYSDVNDMRLFYSWDYRLRASLTAFGRMAVGWIFPSVNAVDTENWGDWARLNEHFIWVGLGLWLFIFWRVGLQLKRQMCPRFRPSQYPQNSDKIELITVAAFFTLYLPVAGLFFPHRHFYSVRYFEAPILAILPLIALKLEKLTEKGFRRSAVGLLGIIFYLLHLESITYQSNLNVIRKSLALTPANPGLMTLEQKELLNLREWDGLDSSETSRLIELEAELDRRCNPDNLGNLSNPGNPKLSNSPNRNGDLCWTYWDLPGRMEGKPVAAAVERHLQQSLAIFKELNSKIYDRLSEPVGRFIPRPYQTSPFSRRRHWRATCQIDGPAAGTRLIQNYLDRHLLDPGIWELSALDHQWSQENCLRD